MSPYRQIRLTKVEKKLVRVVTTVLLVQLTLLFYVFEQSYQGRQRVVEAQRSACERGKADRAVNAKGWRVAQKARQHSAQFERGDQRTGDLDAARLYGRIAASLESRSGKNLNCTAVFPHASLWIKSN